MEVQPEGENRRETATEKNEAAAVDGAYIGTSRDGDAIFAVLRAARRLGNGDAADAFVLRDAGELLPYALPALCRAARHADAGIREQAIELCTMAITHLQDAAGAVVKDLCQALSTDNLPLQRYACNCLAQTGRIAPLAAPAVARLEALVRLTDQRHLPGDAAQALSCGRAFQAMETIVSRSRDERAEHVISALRAFRDRAALLTEFHSLEKLYAEVERQSAADQERVMEYVVAIREGASHHGPMEFESQSVTYRNIQMVPRLQELLKDQDPRVQGFAAQMLMRAALQLKERAADLVPLAFSLLGDENMEVCRKAADTLGRLRIQEAAPALRELLQHSDLRTASAAAYALARIGDEASLTAIAAREKEFAANDLGGALEMLRRKLAAKDSLWIDLYRSESERVEIARHDGEAFAAGNADGRFRLERAGLFAMAALRHVCRAMHNTDAAVAAHAGSTALGITSTMRSELAHTVPYIVKALGDPAPAVRERAQECLEMLGLTLTQAALLDQNQAFLPHE